MSVSLRNGQRRHSHVGNQTPSYKWQAWKPWRLVIRNDISLAIGIFPFCCSPRWCKSFLLAGEEAAESGRPWWFLKGFIMLRWGWSNEFLGWTSTCKETIAGFLRIEFLYVWRESVGILHLYFNSIQHILKYRCVLGSWGGSSRQVAWAVCHSWGRGIFCWLRLLYTDLRPLKVWTVDRFQVRFGFLFCPSTTILTGRCDQGKV